MNLTISGQHDLKVTPALHTHVVEKLKRVVRHFDDLIDVQVSLSVEKDRNKDTRQRAEATILVKGQYIHAHAANEDLYAAVESMVDKLDTQILRYKAKRQGHHHESVRRMA